MGASSGELSVGSTADNWDFAISKKGLYVCVAVNPLYLIA